MRRKKMKFKIEAFPKVLKNDKAGKVVIIYRDHIEFYLINGNAKVIDTHMEVEMAKGSGYHMVNMKDTKTIYIKEKENV
jgi:hypothetical protein